MAHMTDLPLDILSVILVIIAVSGDGARDLARAGATCKMLLTETRKPAILRMVNFRGLTFTKNRFMMHHHVNDLLCRCARVGNRAALSILGKAILVDDGWFWDMRPVEALHKHSLVRMFILHGDSIDIATLCNQLLKYVFLHVGHNAPHENGLVFAILNMSSFETRRLIECNIRAFPTPFTFDDGLMIRVEPPYEAAYREAVIVVYDQLFPLSACY